MTFKESLQLFFLKKVYKLNMSVVNPISTRDRSLSLKISIIINKIMPKIR